MSNLKGTKINQLLRVWPKGTVATSAWLNEQGISSLLKQKYQESGWVESIGYGAVIRAGDTVDWRGALYALQAQLGLKIYVGGKSALELQGYGHFIKFGKSTLHFYTQERKKLPLWFTSHDWGEKLQVHKSQFLPSDKGFISHKELDFSLKVSAPERAFLEMLSLTPKDQDLKECYYILENMIDLRPSVLQSLLEKVTSIKVKRLFFFLADKLNHPWLETLNKEKISLGSGKRQLVEGGVLDKTYLITVPKELMDGD